MLAEITTEQPRAMAFEFRGGIGIGPNPCPALGISHGRLARSLSHPFAQDMKWQPLLLIVLPFFLYFFSPLFARFVGQSTLDFFCLAGSVGCLAFVSRQAN